MKHVIWTALFCLLLVACDGAANSAGNSDRGNRGGRGDVERRDPVVEVVAAWRGSIPRTERSTGRIEARNTADVHAQVGEVVLDAPFEPGDYVTRGTILARLRSDELLLQLRAAELALQEAELTHNSNQLELTKRRTDLERIERYFDPDRPDTSRLFSKEAWDAARLEFDKARNAVESSRLARDKAAGEVAVAARRVTQAEVKAPIDGFVVERLIRVNELAASGALLFRLADFDELEVRLDIAEARLPEIREAERIPTVGLLGLRDKPRFDRAQVVSLAITALPGERFLGYVDRVFPTVDETRGMAAITVRVIQPRKLDSEVHGPLLDQLDRDTRQRVLDTGGKAPRLTALRPGMWVDARIATEYRRDALLIPGAALVGGTESIWVVTPDENNPETGVARSVNVANRRGVSGEGVFELLPPSREGRSRGRPGGAGERDVDEGSLIVVAGQTGLREGARVRIRDLSR